MADHVPVSIEDYLSERQVQVVRFLAAVRVALFGMPKPKHSHEWEVTDTHKTETRVSYNHTSKSAVYVSRCKHCGKIKSDRIQLS